MRMKHIVITGATSGIGKALAILCASKGYRVTACGRNSEVLRELEAAPNISTKQFDVTDTEDVKRHLGGFEADIIVLNAGVCEYVDAEHIEPEMFTRVFNANFFGVVNCAAVLVPNLKSGAQVVAVDSLSRLLPFTRCQAYGASKAALHYFTKTLDVDLKHRGIRVQSVSPGFVETSMTDRNDFSMPMIVSDTHAAKALLTGVESGTRSIYFPLLFSVVLRLIGLLPDFVKVALSRKLRENTPTREVTQ